MTRARSFAKLVLLALLTGCLEQTLVVSDQQGTDDDREDGSDARSDEPSEELSDEQDDDAGPTRGDASRDDSSQPRTCERCGNFDPRRCSPLNRDLQWAFCSECGCCFDDRDCATPGRDWVCARPLGSERTDPGRCFDPAWTTTP